MDSPWCSLFYTNNYAFKWWYSNSQFQIFQVLVVHENILLYRIQCGIHFMPLCWKKERKTDRHTERSAAKCRQILIRRCPFSWHRRRLILCVQDKFEINARYTTYLQNSSQCLPIPHHRLICTESRKQQQWRARRDVTLQYCSARKHPATKVWSGWSN